MLHLDLRLVTGANPAQIQLRWVTPDNQTASIAAAAAAAQAANKAVIFAYDEGTEGSDRGGSNQQAGITLPGYQDALISAVAAAQPNTVVVLNTGDPVLMPWASQVKSILEMWYPGQLGGPATADVLLGNVDPGGHLPVTFPADATHFPTYDPTCDLTTLAGCDLYPGVVQPPHSYRTVTNLDATLGNGIFQGYRWYDKHGVTPLFGFGYGLSYTSFRYTGLSVSPRSDGSVDVAFDVQNTGAVAGSDVAQVYVGAGPDVPGVQQAVRSLRGFDRVTLAPSETKHEVINLAPRSFQYWSTAQNQWVTNAGPRTIWVGNAEASQSLQLGSTLPQSATVGGTVPATLSIVLGAAPAFGPFTPGVAKDYFASTTATVTAGNAALIVQDTSPFYTNHLVNGSFALPQELQVMNSGGAYQTMPAGLRFWGGPTSSEAVPVNFKQSIGANDALRTGSYTKTLTFTLSTTTP
jgi:beta-glucosidase